MKGLTERHKQKRYIKSDPMLMERRNVRKVNAKHTSFNM